MSDTGRQIVRTGRNPSSSVSLFKKVLQAFEDGQLSYADVQSDLRRLLDDGASLQELREVLRHFESIEPLPEYALVEILFNEAMERAAPSTPASTPVSAAGATARPAPARTTIRGAEPTPSQGESASPIEERIARDKADYKALTYAYERARDAGSAAAARTIELESELAAARSALESEQSNARETDKTLAESVASAEAARARRDELLRKSERFQAELRTVRDSISARDATIDQLRLALGARDEQLAALQREHTTREAALDARASAGTRIEADLQAEHARSAALGAELANARIALESEHTKVQRMDRARAESAASAEAAQARRDDALREAERLQTELRTARAELRTARDSLAGRDATILQVQNSLAERDVRLAALQREHAQAVTALESRATACTQLETDLQTSRARAAALGVELANARTALESEHSKIQQMDRALAERIAAEEAARKHGEAMEAELEAARTRSDARTAESSYETTVALDLPLERAAAKLAAGRRLEPTLWEFEPAASARFDAQQSASRAGKAPPTVKTRRTAGAVSRTIGLGAVIVVLAAVVWFIVRQGPVPGNVAVVSSAKAPTPATVIHDCPTCPALTVLPAGRFKQGSARAEGVSASFEKPPHWVSIGRPIAISTNAVTVNEFRAFISATGRDMRGCDTYDEKWRYRPESSWESPGFVQTESHPVTCVSWDDAKAYAGWLSTTTGHPYRLPSAAEWEYAARAGGEAVQPWKPDGSDACASANVADRRAARRYPEWKAFDCDDGYVYTAPVGSFKANSFGLNDMLGNVFQWTEDCWHADYTGAAVDGSARKYGDCSERELRGGSWFTIPDFVRASYRNHFAANYRASSVGIRLVRDIAP